MTQQHPSILYFGDARRAAALEDAAAAFDWQVRHTHDTLDLLAAAVFEYPDLIVIEGQALGGRMVYGHLAAADFASPVVILADAIPGWAAHADIVPDDIPAYALVHALAERLLHDIVPMSG
jgi:hypothetical protein